MILPVNAFMGDESKTRGAAGSLAAHVTRDVFYELIGSFEDPPTLIEVKKTWPTRYVYFLQHPAGLFFMSDGDRQDFSNAQVIPVEDVHFPMDFHF